MLQLLQRDVANLPSAVLIIADARTHILSSNNPGTTCHRAEPAAALLQTLQLNRRLCSPHGYCRCCHVHLPLTLLCFGGACADLELPLPGSSLPRVAAFDPFIQGLPSHAFCRPMAGFNRCGLRSFHCPPPILSRGMSFSAQRSLKYCCSAPVWGAHGAPAFRTCTHVTLFAATNFRRPKHANQQVADGASSRGRTARRGRGGAASATHAARGSSGRAAAAGRRAGSGDAMPQQCLRVQRPMAIQALGRAQPRCRTPRGAPRAAAAVQSARRLIGGRLFGASNGPKDTSPATAAGGSAKPSDDTRLGAYVGIPNRATHPTRGGTAANARHCLTCSLLRLTVVLRHISE
eukprot:363925-Chlamydomonas_euryale.AAC.22